MTAPLVILAVLSFVGGWIGLPKVLGENADRFSAFLSPILLPLALTEVPSTGSPQASNGC
jgi:NADH-quinone oxidoreductase subunit L